MTELKKKSSKAFTRMTIILVSLMTLLLIGCSWLVYSHSEKLFEERRQASVMMLTEGVAVAVLEGLLTRDFGSIESRLLQTLSNGSVSSAAVIDMNGKVTALVKRDPTSGRPVAVYNEKWITPPTTGSLSTTNDDGFSCWIREKIRTLWQLKLHEVFKGTHYAASVRSS